MGKRGDYPWEFRQQAVDLVESSGKPVYLIARELGVNASTLTNWVSRSRKEKEVPGALTLLEQEELRALRVEVNRLKMEREILKRAMAFWVKESTE